MTKITQLTNLSSTGFQSFQLNKWHDYYFKLDPQLLNNNLISKSIRLLWDKIESDIKNGAGLGKKK